MADREKKPLPEHKTRSGTPIKPLYEPAQPDPKLGKPGEYPFTRGIYPSMYLGKVWTMRQYAGFGTPAETNQRFKYLLEAGQTGLSVALDLPTQLGFDSDAPEAVGEVGKVGVAIDSLADMETIFEGIPLDKVSTSFTINGTATILLAMYRGGRGETGRRQGADRRHDPERSPEGVRRARRLDLPHRAVDAAGGRRHRVLHREAAALQSRSRSPRTSATPAPRPPRRRPTRSPTGSPTSRRASIAA